MGKMVSELIILIENFPGELNAPLVAVQLPLIYDC